MEQITKSLVVRCKEFFGLLPGQRLQEFSAEVVALSSEDKQEFVDMFNAAGMPTVLSKLR